MSGEKAGVHTATYSAPPSSGVLYRTHSPGARDDRLARAYVGDASVVFDAQQSTQHQRDLLELGSLSRLHPALRRHHAGDAHVAVAGVHAPGILFNPFRLVARGFDDGGLLDESWHGGPDYTTDVKKICDTILDAIGHTPMVRINAITRGLVSATVLAKVETFNPGNSIKDRMAVRMIEDAERAGLLKPGGTIIEGTSGNTGMGLAIAAVIKGYKCIFTTTDKQSKEKIDALKAFGAEVFVCPTNVDPEDPRSYYSVSSRLEKEVPNSWKANQYDNLSNSAAHYEQTGPEIWEQTDGRITHLVVGVGTGGTISGAGRFLKEKNPRLKVWGIDTYGSVFKKYKETGVFDKNEIYPYITEGHRRGLPAAERGLLRDRPLREGDRQGRRADDAAHRARGGHLRGQLGRLGHGWPAAAAAALRA